MNKRHNPEKRSWRGRSYKKGGQSIRGLREQVVGCEEDFDQAPPEPVVDPEDVRLYLDCLRTWGERCANDELGERIRRWRAKDPAQQNRLFAAVVRVARSGA